MAYRLEVKRSATKDLRRLPKDVQERSIEAVDALVDEPRPPGCVKMVGHDALYRIRIGDWRIIYDVDDTEALITILAIRHRREVYRDF